MSSRGVIYIVWGSNMYAMLRRSWNSLRAFHPNLPIEVFPVTADNWIKARIEKTRMAELSPFEETLYLDADTVVMGNLDYAFEKSRRFGLACCINECPWARRNTRAHAGDIIEYNTGVLFFTQAMRGLFSSWTRLANELDSALPWIDGDTLKIMQFNDQCSFAAAVEETGISPFVLPLNWNFRPQFYKSFFGPIKVWHAYDDVPPDFYKLNEYYSKDGAIIQFHERAFGYRLSSSSLTSR
jgi:hypothetical protein